ncbi:MAG: pyruvate kinase, partial [Hyphomicrobiaceae bacterium]
MLSEQTTTKSVVASESISLHTEIDALIASIRRESDAQAAAWRRCLDRADFEESAANLAHYLAFRRRDLRTLQRSLMKLGLSSLGRLESRVLPTLVAVKAALAALARLPQEEAPSGNTFFAGEWLLRTRTDELLGPSTSSRHRALLVTCPTEAADDPSFMLALARRGIEAVRINCAHVSPDRWERLILNARAAEKTSGRRLKIFMDLGGPKIRTGEMRLPEGPERVKKGALLAIVPSGGLERVVLYDEHCSIECTLPEALSAARVGDRVYVDDGKLAAKVERKEPWGLVARVTQAATKGVRLKRVKGLNFPDTTLKIAALTDKDRTDLDFVAAHADGIGFSFVQSAADVEMLQDALRERRPRDWRTLSLILKIETARAVRNLPDIVVHAAGRQPTAIMIARGDLAIEIGFARTAEMQEEILWIGEAAHVPVIWATQVLEHLVRKGTPSRGEMTDAAMAARAECVML